MDGVAGHPERFNLLERLACPPGGGERFDELLRAGGVRIERIVSDGCGSPPGFWYDQEEGEFVLLLRGSACLEIEGQGRVFLKEGDWYDLPARTRHRVERTEPGTVWLAVFYPQVGRRALSAR